MACAQLRRCRDESPCAAFAVLMGTPAGSGKIGKGNVRLQHRGYGGLIYGCFGHLLGIFGIHHILNFLEISMLSQTGWNMFNPIGTCGNMAQAGAVLAVAIKSRNTKMKQIAYPSAFSATLGITEPAVFGVTLRLGKPFIMSMIGGGVGGFLASILGLKATGIPGTLLYLNNQLPYYILTNVVAMAVAFALTYTIGYKEEAETAPASKGSGSPASNARPVLFMLLFPAPSFPPNRFLTKLLPLAFLARAWASSLRTALSLPPSTEKSRLWQIPGTQSASHPLTAWRSSFTSVWTRWQ